jgi:dinuclear metal center YbgI/SA1388 family protein
MAAQINDLLTTLNTLLTPEAFNDYCPNGLQVQGKASVNKIITGVTASQLLIDRAIEEQADAILVHHGFFWKGEDPCITGMKKKRLEALLMNEISLLAYHLPLDALPEYGNNAQLAKLLGIEINGGLEPENPYSVGNIGRLSKPMSCQALSQLVTERLGRKPLTIEAGDHTIETIAWCTGGGQSFIDLAAAAGVDAYLSGEISESTVHISRETGTHYIAAGHHATERYGVQAVGELLAKQFGITHQFIDIDSPA